MGNKKTILEKYRLIPLQVRASGWFFVCFMIQKLISVVSTAVFTRIMSTEDYGLISIYNSWSDLFVMVASLNLAVGCFNVGMTRYENSRKQWVSSLQILSILTATVFSVLFISTFTVWNRWVNLPFVCIMVMVITFFSIPALNLWTAKQKYECSYRKLVAVSVLYSALVFIVSLICVLVSENKGITKIVTTAVVTSIIGLILLFSNIIASEKKTNIEYIKFAFKYNTVMMPAFLATIILNQIDRIMIDRMVSRDAAGIYSVSYNAAYMISIVSSAINATYNPWLMQKVKSKNYNNVDGIGTTVTGGLLLIIFAFIFCAPEFVKIIASKEYYEAIYIIPSVAGSTFFSVIYTLYCPIAQYYVRVKQLSFITVVASIANVVLNYIAIRKWGYIAAGYTTYICYSIYGWGTGLYCLKILKENRMSGNIYNIKKLIVLTIALSLAVVIAPFLYDGYVVRYVLLAVVCVIFAYYGKKYKDTIMKMREKR